MVRITASAGRWPPLPGAPKPPPVPDPAPGLAGSPTVELVGPFEIAAIGNRLGSTEVSRASMGRSTSDFELGIVVKNEDTETAPRMDARAMRLIELSRRAGNQGISIVLHPRGDGPTP